MEHTHEIKQFILQYIEENRTLYFDMARQIWERPELGMEEHFASTLLADFLEGQGFAVERGAAGMPTAFVATWGEGKPVIGFSMEYDALPGLSQKDQWQQEPVRKGAEILAAAAVDVVTDPALLEACKAEWTERLGGREYRSLLPEGTPVPLEISKETMAKYR